MDRCNNDKDYPLDCQSNGQTEEGGRSGQNSTHKTTTTLGQRILSPELRQRLNTYFLRASFDAGPVSEGK